MAKRGRPRKNPLPEEQNPPEEEAIDIFDEDFEGLDVKLPENDQKNAQEAIEDPDSEAFDGFDILREDDSQKEDQDDIEVPVEVEEPRKLVFGNATLRDAKRKANKIHERAMKRGRTFASALDINDDEELTDLEVLLIDLSTKKETEGWKIDVYRISPTHDMNGNKCAGFISSFSLSQYPHIQQIVARHFGGTEYRMDLRQRGMSKASLTFSVVGPPRSPSQDVLDKYFTSEDNVAIPDKRSKEHDDYVRENERLRSEKALLEQESRYKDLMGIMQSKFDTISAKLEGMNKPQEKVDVVGSMAALVVAFTPLLKPLLESKKSSPEDGGIISSLIDKVDRLSETTMENRIVNAIEKMGGNKTEDKTTKMIMDTLLKKALDGNSTDKMMEDIFPSFAKKIFNMKLDSLMPSGPESDEVTFKDILNGAIEVLKGGGQKMMPPGMLPGQYQQQMALPQPQMPVGGTQPAQGFQTPIPPQNIPQAQAQSPQPANQIYISPDLQQAAIEWIQSGRSGSDLAEVVETNNVGGTLISKAVLGMMGLAPFEQVHAEIVRYLVSQSDPNSQQLAIELGQSRGREFLKEMVGYFTGIEEEEVVIEEGNDGQE